MKESFKKYGFFYLFLLILILIIFIFLFKFEKNKNDNLTFAMLDVGQGDALFIKSPTGQQILIDGGRDKSVLRELNKVMPFWDRSIDILIITNPDLDHIAGFLDVLDKYKVGYIIEPGTYNDSSTYRNIEKKVQDKNIKRLLGHYPLKLDIGGGAYLDFLFPDRDVSTWDNNDGSIVSLLSYGNNKIMLTGDATIKTEEIILNKFKDSYLESLILKVGHHGSKTSTGEDFVKTIKPKYALISSGKDNSYGHPHKEVLDTLKTFGVEILRTDTLRTIVFTCDKIELCKLK